MRQQAIVEALRAELARQADHPHIGGVFDGDVEALAAALAPVLFAEPSARARDIAESGTATTLDAAYVARDLLPLLKAIKPEERAIVLDYLDADPRDHRQCMKCLGQMIRVPLDESLCDTCEMEEHGGGTP